jgi:hypothetical protein
VHELFPNIIHIIIIYSKSEEDKAFIHANCVFDDASQVNESGFTLECYMYLVLFDTSLEIESVTLYSKI